VDREGKTTMVPEKSANLSGALSTGMLIVPAEEFDRIKEFRVQRRQYQWVEFQRVALKPGINTIVKMVDSVDRGNPALKPDSLAFDAAREVGLPMDDEGCSWFLNLDDGGIGFLDGYPKTGWKRNLKLADGAVMLFGTNRVLTVAGAGVCLVSLPDTDSARAWENPEPSDLSIPVIPRPGVGVNVAGQSGSPPVTFAFLTVKGACGLLQFTGFSDAPQSVLVRYKTLVGTVRKGGETGPLRAPEG